MTGLGGRVRRGGRRYGLPPRRRPFRRFLSRAVIHVAHGHVGLSIRPSVPDNSGRCRDVQEKRPALVEARPQARGPRGRENAEPRNAAPAAGEECTPPHRLPVVISRRGDTAVNVRDIRRDGAGPRGSRPGVGTDRQDRAVVGPPPDRTRPNLERRATTPSSRRPPAGATRRPSRALRRGSRRFRSPRRHLCARLPHRCTGVTTSGYALTPTHGHSSRELSRSAGMGARTV